MKSEHLGSRVTLYGGDSRDVLKGLPNNSVDSVVTDPPYALVSIVKRFGGEGAVPAKGDVYARAAAGFMGKTWDTGETAFAVEFWREVMRVLKPGGYVLAASSTRTYHRLAVAIEDAGFEIRDMVQWLYGSGFPKSHAPLHGIRSLPRTVSRSEWRWFNRLARIMTGSALKPACEPWVMARKPLIGTIAQNVLAHGTGSMNIGKCRIETADDLNGGAYAANPTDREEMWGADAGNSWRRGGAGDYVPPTGRWPANVVHDGSSEVVEMFPDTASGSRQAGSYGGMGFHGSGKWSMPGIAGDTGSAARFFYSAKADAMDRLGAKHPTVKPVDLMQYFTRLVTPPGGVVLDPFAGTGTTGEAAWREGFSCILIEREPQYLIDIRKRLSLVDAGPSRRKAAATRKTVTGHGPLFGDG